MLIERFADSVAAELPAVGGEHVKTIGDALMLRIPEPGWGDPARAPDRARRLRRSTAHRRSASACTTAPRSSGTATTSVRLVNLAARVLRARGGRRSAPCRDLTAALVPRARRRRLRFSRPARTQERQRAGRDLRRARRRRDGRSAPCRPGVPDGSGPRTRAGAPAPRRERVLLLLARVRGRVRPATRAVRRGLTARLPECRSGRAARTRLFPLRFGW